MPPYVVASYCINSGFFLGGSERLRTAFMFHCDLKWRARLVKRGWFAEGHGIFEHDNTAARYTWGVMNLAVVFIRP
jgi:hypothetical protein